MQVSRRDLLTIAMGGVAAGVAPRALATAQSAPSALLDFAPLGNVTLLHITDPHAHLRPVFYREPDTLIGIGDEHSKLGNALVRDVDVH